MLNKIDIYYFYIDKIYDIKIIKSHKPKEKSKDIIGEEDLIMGFLGIVMILVNIWWH